MMTVGLTEIVPADLATKGPRASGTVPVMKSVQQVSIFLGGRLGRPASRIRQTRLPDFAGYHSEPTVTELQNHNVEVIPAAPRVEDFSDLSKGPVNDLTIQRKLVEMLGNHAPSSAGCQHDLRNIPGSGNHVHSWGQQSRH